MKKTALISGASIAGLTMAYWLNHYGYKVTVVEISSTPRKGGSPIDVRGEAVDVAARMGVLDKIKAVRLSTGLEFVNTENESIGTMKDAGAIAPGEDIELQRDHLVNIIYEAASNNIEYLFSNRIENLIQYDDKVEVIFKDGTNRSFDFVFGADGVHSSVRKLTFGIEEQFAHFFGLYFAIAEVDKDLGRKNYAQMYNTPNKMATIYAYNDRADALLAFRSPEIDYDYRNGTEQRQMLIDNFAGKGWKIPDILNAMSNTENLYFDQVSQIKMTSWTKGRVALVGDAAHCAGFPTGMGTTLAMQGATILADELAASNGDYHLAFSKYNSSFKPFVETVQATIVDGIDFLIPETDEAIDMRNKMAN